MDISLRTFIYFKFIQLYSKLEKKLQQQNYVLSIKICVKCVCVCPSFNVYWQDIAMVGIIL